MKPKNENAVKLPYLYRYCVKCQKWLGGKSGYECNHEWFYRILIKTPNGTKSKNVKKGTSVEELLKLINDFRFQVKIKKVQVDDDKLVLEDEIQSFKNFLKMNNQSSKIIAERLRHLNLYFEFRNFIGNSISVELLITDNLVIYQFNEYLKLKHYSDETIRKINLTVKKWYGYLIYNQKIKIKTHWVIKQDLYK